MQRNHIKRLQGMLDLPKLVRLDLSHNGIETIDEQYLSGLPKLQYLTLSYNSIHELQPNIFRKTVSLTHVNLNGNRISSVARVFSHLHRLEALDLSKNKICDADRTRSIKVIDLSFNGIGDISIAFRGLTELRELNLKSNIISRIQDDTFRDNVLRLHRNHIVSFNGSVSNLPQLEYLGASYNAISRLEVGEFGNDAALVAIRLEENNITDVQHAFVGATSLRSLTLAGNGVRLLRRSDFAPELSGVAVVRITNNPLICDCRLAWLREEDSDIQMRGIATCAKPQRLKGKPLGILAKEDFLRWEDECEPGCHCECHEGSLGEREISVNCSSATVGRIPKVLPKGTTQLDLSGNQLRILDDTITRAAPHLRVLSLKDNLLLSVNVSSIPTTVNSLDLRGNKLRWLPFLLLTQLNVTSIWLSGNDYTCDCADYNLRQWIQAHGNVIQDARGIMCGKGPNALVSRKKFFTLGQKDLCPAAIPQGVVYLLIAFGVLTVLLALSATYLRYKHVLRTCLRDHGVRGLAWRVEEDDADKLFDVFVSFSSKDIAWVHDQILPELEAMGLSHCTYERNFKGGYLLQDIIRDAVACSRRTLPVLTENFLASEWCRLEFRLAHQRALQDNINRLVIVLLDELHPSELDEDLRLYVRSANYLRWGEPNFWDRLLHSLATRGAQRKLIVKGEQRLTQLTDNTTGAIELT
ncbi:protein toll [Rhipicephalus sanguineus]|uniref:protein toll n=1 Tax=Rhipicephalus sanguineus TaxID=34632 RepID=UPI0020C53E8B|nr:protein toll [Rhipicephalus sanguineus]